MIPAFVCCFIAVFPGCGRQGQYEKAPLKRGFLEFGAGNEIRTRDPNLGKVVLYQLSYSRVEGVYYRYFQRDVNPISSQF